MYGGSADVESLDRPSYWLCMNEDCAEEFVITIGSMSRQQGDDARGMIDCPECGSDNTARAHPCHNCGRHLPLYGHAMLPPVCPHCEHELGIAHDDSTHTHGIMFGDHEQP